MFVFLGTQKSCTRRAWEGIPTGLVHSSFANISCFYFLFYEQRLSSSSLVNSSSVTNIIIIKINIIITIIVILSLIIIIFIIIISIILKNLHLCHHLIIIIIAITGQHHQDHYYCTISLPITKIFKMFFHFWLGLIPWLKCFILLASIDHIWKMYAIILLLLPIVKYLTELWKTDSLHVKTAAKQALCYLYWWELGERFHTLRKEKKALNCLQTRARITELPLNGW